MSRTLYCDTHLNSPYIFGHLLKKKRPPPHPIVTGTKNWAFFDYTFCRVLYGRHSRINFTVTIQGLASIKEKRTERRTTIIARRENNGTGASCPPDPLLLSVRFSLSMIKQSLFITRNMVGIMFASSDHSLQFKPCGWLVDDWGLRVSFWPFYHDFWNSRSLWRRQDKLEEEQEGKVTYEYSVWFAYISERPRIMIIL